MHAVTEVLPLICSEGSNSVLPLLSDIQSADPAWYQLLVSQLTDEHKKDLEEVFRLADQKKAAAGLFHLLHCLVVLLTVSWQCSFASRLNILRNIDEIHFLWRLISISGTYCVGLGVTMTRSMVRQGQFWWLMFGLCPSFSTPKWC